MVYLWKDNHHIYSFPLPIFQEYKKSNEIKWNIFIYKIYKHFSRSNLDHTSPFEGFWSPKSGPLRRWKKKASIFLYISTIPLLMKVDFFLFVCPCFVARGVIIFLSWCALTRYSLTPFTKWYFFFSHVEGSIPIPQVGVTKTSLNRYPMVQLHILSHQHSWN